ncbi:MAG: D-aminoacyl-tRNA deacylase [Candidatus Omnitrophota bacterium]
MRLVIQRVSRAEVYVKARLLASIKKGALVFLAVAKADTQQQADALADKLLKLRCFADAQGKMNLSLADIAGEILVVSQFTLLADCQGGNRPSFDNAAEPKPAEELYAYFVKRIKASGLRVETGEFGAIMEVNLANDGPVTFIIDSPDV